MKKFFAALMVVASLLAVSCGKDGKEGGSTKTDEEIDGNLPASLKYSSYIPVIIDGESFKAIEKRVACDLTVDDKTRNLWVWEETYTAGAGEGLNFYGNTSGYTDLLVGGKGWSGAGWCIYTSYLPKDAEAPFVADPNPFDKLAATLGTAPNDWTFHLAYKGAARVAHIVGIDYAGASYKFAIGEGSLEDKGVTYTAIAPVTGEFEAGEWMEYEIPVKDLGLDFSSKNYENGTNIFWCLSGGVTGTEIKLDAVFFYKK